MLNVILWGRSWIYLLVVFDGKPEKNPKWSQKLLTCLTWWCLHSSGSKASWHSQQDDTNDLFSHQQGGGWILTTSVRGIFPMTLNYLNLTGVTWEQKIILKVPLRFNGWERLATPPPKKNDKVIGNKRDVPLYNYNWILKGSFLREQYLGLKNRPW